MCVALPSAAKIAALLTAILHIEGKASFWSVFGRS